MQAAPIGYYAARSKDTRALRRACEIYCHALQTHRASLEALHSNGCTETSFAVGVLRGTLCSSVKRFIALAPLPMPSPGHGRPRKVQLKIAEPTVLLFEVTDGARLTYCCEKLTLD
jgi:hypothetical protein